MRGGGYFVHTTSWDGVKGRLTHLGNYEHLGLEELRDVLLSVLESHRPGTEFTIVDGQTWVQAPLFD